MPAKTAPPPSPSEANGRHPTTASYACLALLGERALTASQIIDGMRTSGMKYLWPRANSRLYQEPKLLCDRGWAEIVGERAGGRGTRYQVTDAGRAALDAWLSEPGGTPSLEYEALLKAYCCARGTKEQFLTQLQAMKEHVVRGYTMLLMTSVRLSTEGVTTQPLGRVSAMLFEYSRYELDMRARWLCETEKWLAEWPQDPPTQREIEGLQAWFLARNQDVAESLKRFRAGDLVEVGTRRPIRD